MLKLQLFDEKQKVIFKGKTTKLRIGEELIIEKSKEWFDDANPCFIHRSAVMKRLFIELEDELLTFGDQWVDRSDLTTKAIAILDEYDNLSVVEYKQ